MLIDDSNERTPLLQSHEVNHSIGYPQTPPLCSSVSSATSADSLIPRGQRLRNLISRITVEPVLFLIAFSTSIISLFYTNMMVDKVCSLQLNYSKEVCGNLDSGDYEKEQNIVQEITNLYGLYSTWIQSILGITAMVILGAWSDTIGRKVPIVVPLIGETLKSIIILANAYFWYWKPYYIILASIPSGLGGSWCTLLMAAYAYVGNHSGTRSRTTRLSLAGVLMNAAWPVGHIVGAVCYIKGGYVLVFGTQLFFMILNLFYVLVRFDSGPPPKREEEEEQEESERESRKITVSTVKKSLMVVFKSREGCRRAHIIAHIVCIWVTVISYEAASFTYLYARKKFEWTYYDYTIWSIIGNPISLVASCGILPFLSYYLQLEDSLLGFMGSASHIFFGTIVGTAPYSWLMYLAQVVSMLSSMVVISSRGAISKLVQTNELGGIFTTIALGELISPIVFSPIFTVIYNETLSTFPGAVFIVGAGIGVVVICIYTWILTNGREQVSRTRAP